MAIYAFIEILGLFIQDIVFPLISGFSTGIGTFFILVDVADRGMSLGFEMRALVSFPWLSDAISDTGDVSEQLELRGVTSYPEELDGIKS